MTSISLELVSISLPAKFHFLRDIFAHVAHTILTSANEVMFYPPFVCLSVCLSVSTLRVTRVQLLLRWPRTVAQFALEWGYMSLTHSFAANYEKIRHRLPKCITFGLHYCRIRYGSSINHCNFVGPQATEFGEITQNDGHTLFKVIQCQQRESRSTSEMRSVSTIF